MNRRNATYVGGKTVSVLGAARSGLASARLLVDHGANVFVSEYGAMLPSAKETLIQLGVAFEDGGHTPRTLDCDFMVISPGVPSTVPIVVQTQKAGIPVFSEIEISSWFCEAPMVAITGSNGKTTTTELIGHLFRTNGSRTWVCGNVGTPFADVCDKTSPTDIVVIEVSSFQLDHIDQFKPKVSLLLNVTPDHLDRYDYQFEKYAASKLRIVQNQDASDMVVFNADDQELRKEFGSKRGNGPLQYAISIEKEVQQGGFLLENQLVLRKNNQNETLMYVDELALRGRHNVFNSLAAAVAARVMEVRSDVVRESLKTFSGVPHRLEAIREVDGVRYVNDSKATNVNAVWFALESFTEPVVLIAGGRDKGNDYSSLRPLLSGRVRALISIGEAAERINAELGSCVSDSVIAESLADAVKLAHLLAKPGDVVLLSPACSSFDMFNNYEDRGDQFKQLVSNI